MFMTIYLVLLLNRTALKNVITSIVISFIFYFFLKYIIYKWTVKYISNIS